MNQSLSLENKRYQQFIDKTQEQARNEKNKDEEIARNN